MSSTSASMFERILAIGTLRLLLMASAIVFAFMVPVANLPDYSDNWNLFFNGVVPATAPLIFIVQMLDILMANVWKDGETEERIAHLNFVIRAHLITAGILFASFMWIFLPVLMP